MSYKTKYSATVADHSGTTYQVNLKNKNYTGSSTQITNYTTQPLTIAYRGGREEIDNTIRGSEANFNFYVKETENYDDLFNSNYKDWQLEILKTTGSTDIISGASSMSSDTSTGQAWSATGSSMFNHFLMPPYSVSANKSSFNSGDWNAQFSETGHSTYIFMNGSTTFASGNLPYDGSTTVIGHAHKTSNGGIAEGDGQVSYYLNGTSIGSIPFLLGDDVSDVTKNFTVSINNLLRIDISEQRPTFSSYLVYKTGNVPSHPSDEFQARYKSSIFTTNLFETTVFNIASNTGNSSTQIATIPETITVTAGKTTNSGIARMNGKIRFDKNGSPFASTSFTAGSNVGFPYFSASTSVTRNDVVKVWVFETGATATTQTANVKIVYNTGTIVPASTSDTVEAQFHSAWANQTVTATTTCQFDVDSETGATTILVASTGDTVSVNYGKLTNSGYARMNTTITTILNGVTVNTQTVRNGFQYDYPQSTVNVTGVKGGDTIVVQINEDH